MEPAAARPRLPIFDRLLHDVRGMAMTEFALVLPFLVVMMSSGLELANYVLATKRIGEIAGQLADNASRMGDQTVIKNKPVTEAEINDVFIGAQLQAGGIDLEGNGRIILSSLEADDEGNQKIGWQRCFGTLDHPSSFGSEGDAGISGMGPPGDQIVAAPGTAVMVVEIAYEYERLVPLVSFPLRQITEYAAFTVRDDRDLSGVRPVAGVTASNC